MIYLFTWDNEYLVREKTLTWKKAYVEKHGDFNLIHFKNLKDVDNNILSQDLLSTWFMWEKKLIIIDDLPLSTSNKKIYLTEKQNFLENILDKIPESNIVIFSSSNPDKRSKFYKNIKKISTKIEEFNSWDIKNIFNIILKKYNSKIDNDAINLIIKYKSSNLEKIISEIDKLLINNDFINTKLISENIIPELEESIFTLIDDLLNLNVSESFKKIDIILEQNSVYAFYNNLIANLKVLVYIKNLKNPLSNSLLKGERIEQNSIKDDLNLWNRSFLVNKNYKISTEKLNNLFVSLVDLDKKMKSWKFIGSDEKDFKFEIEKVILKLKL